MKRAVRQLQPTRQAVSAGDGHGVSPRPFLVSVEHSVTFAELEAFSAARSELAAVMGDVLSVTLQLTLMLPRPMLERFVEGVIERLDGLDGDPDLEPIDEREPDW